MDAQVLNLCAGFVSAEDSGSLYLRIPRDTMVLLGQRVEEESKGMSKVRGREIRNTAEKDSHFPFSPHVTIAGGKHTCNFAQLNSKIRVCR